MDMIKKVLCSVFLVLVSVVLLVPFLYTVILSFTDYSPLHGIFGSVWVGLANFAQLFSAPYFSALLRNTLTISLIGLLLGSAYILLSSLAIGSVKNRIWKGLLTATFCLPAVLPINFFALLIPQEVLVTPSFLLQLLVGAGDGLRLAGLVVIAALFIKDNVLRESGKVTLLFIALRLMSLFTTDGTLATSVYNPLTYEVLDTFAANIFRQGMQNGELSYGAAIHVAKVGMQLLSALAGCIILLLITRKKELPTDENRYSGFSVFAILPLVLLIAVVAAGGSLFPVFLNELVMKGYINGFIIALLSAIVVTQAAFGISMLARNAGIIGIILLTVLCATGNNLIGEYLMTRSAGLMNTILGVLLQNLSMVSVIALVFTFITKRERSAGRVTALLAVGFGITFAWFWGDTLAPMISLTDRDLFPLSLMLREVMMSMTEGAPLTTLPYILMPLIPSTAGVLFGALLQPRKKEEDIEWDNNVVE